MTVGGGTRAGRGGQSRLALGGRGLELGLLLVAGVHEDVAGAAVHGDHRSLGDFTGTGQGHHGRHTERPRQDGAVTRRPALLGDETEHEGRVQQRGVGGRQVPGHQHVGLVTVRDPGHRDAQQTGDDTIPHIVEVGHTAA